MMRRPCHPAGLRAPVSIPATRSPTPAASIASLATVVSPLPARRVNPVPSSFSRSRDPRKIQSAGPSRRRGRSQPCPVPASHAEQRGYPSEGAGPLPSPPGRGAGGEGPRLRNLTANGRISSRPHPNPLSRGERGFPSLQRRGGRSVVPLRRTLATDREGPFVQHEMGVLGSASVLREAPYEPCRRMSGRLQRRCGGGGRSGDQRHAARAVVDGALGAGRQRAAPPGPSADYIQPRSS